MTCRGCGLLDCRCSGTEELRHVKEELRNANLLIERLRRERANTLRLFTRHANDWAALLIALEDEVAYKEAKPELPVTVPDSPKSKAWAVLAKEAMNAPYGVPAKAAEYSQVELDDLIQEIADDCFQKVETKGFLNSKGFFKQTKAKSHLPRKSERKSPKPTGKKNAGAPKRKSSTKGRKSRKTSKIPPRGSSKFPKHPNKFQEYEDNHRNDLTPSFFSEGFDDE